MTTTQDRSYRVGIAGIAIESSTFTPHRTSYAEFSIQRGAELGDRYPFLTDWHWPGAEPGVAFIPIFGARALPGGAVLPEVYDRLEAELLDGLRAEVANAPLDGFYFDIHGAMNVAGRDDAEGQLIAKIRQIVGPECLITASYDLHGQVSRDVAATVDVLAAYRTAPHIDYVETRERACRNLVRCLTEGIRPVRAWTRVPVLLPGEKTSTRVEPAQSVYATLEDSERLPGIIDAALLVGYAWADEPRSSATVFVSGTDESVVVREAERIARDWWAVRDQFEFCAPAGQAAWCIDQAFASTERPFFISDSGDNPTGGGSNDVAWLLGELLARPELASGARTAIWASCVAPDAVHACFDAGVGGGVEVSVGGVFGGSDPVALAGVVTHLEADDAVGGPIAVVRSGGVSAVLTTRRKPFHYVAELTKLGLDPAAADLTAIKIGYLQPDLYAAARGWVLGLTPGGVDQDLHRLPYERIERPMYPLDAEMADPDLTPVVFHS